MNAENFIMQVTNHAILLTIMISLPAILGSLVIGLSVAIFSATTQIQEQTLSFAPKMIVVYTIIGATASYMGGLLLRFSIRLFSEFPRVVS